MKIKNWEIVEEANGGAKLPAGGYVAKITGVDDVASKEYLWIEYDIAEGEHTGHFGDDFAAAHPYIHRFSRSYKDAALGFFKTFLVALEKSNTTFDIADWETQSDEQQFIGQLIGIVLGTEKYTNTKGEDKERLNVVQILPAQDIRDGKFKVPPVEDNRETIHGVATTSIAHDAYGTSEIPF